MTWTPRRGTHKGILNQNRMETCIIKTKNLKNDQTYSYVINGTNVFPKAFSKIYL